jgi:SAM-dependent methyltransferase
MKLNLGSGEFPKPGFVNLDRDALQGVDVVHDLDVFPYPFADGQFDRIEADHVLEHLGQVFDVMREIHRILAPGGVVVIRVPHFSRGFTHPEHRRGFNVTFPCYFDPAFPGGYCGVAFTCLRMRLRWFAEPHLKRAVLPRPVNVIGRGAGAAIDALANLSPLACSRIWCYWVGGFEEIQFVLRKA